MGFVQGKRGMVDGNREDALDEEAAARRRRAVRTPGLDAIRGATIILVLAGHTGIGDLDRAGVTLFFVLSGYLITSLLMAERERTGRVSLRAFYRRRVARLAPPLVLVAATGGIVSFAIGDSDTLTGSWVSLTYVSNLLLPWFDMGLMKHTWSLAVEEQFYLLWPFGLILLRRPILVLGAVVLLVWLLRAVTPLVGDVEFRTDLRIDAAALGALAALLRWRLPGWAGLVAVALIVAMSAPGWGDRGAGYTLVAALSVVAVAGSMPWRAVPVLGGLGRISYGVYLWHYPLFAWLGWPLGLLLTIPLCYVQFRWLEEPLRMRLGSNAHHARIEVVAPGLMMGVMRPGSR